MIPAEVFGFAAAEALKEIIFCAVVRLWREFGPGRARRWLLRACVVCD
jgi:hypothetical protein